MKYKGKELPCDECGGQCCRYAPIEMKTWEKIKHEKPADAVVILRWGGTPKEAVLCVKPGTDGECAFLENGRCSIYTYRPRSCRAVGVLFPCAYVDPDGVDKMLGEIRRKNPGYKFQSEISETVEMCRR